MKHVCIVCDGHWDQLQGGAELQLDLLSRGLSESDFKVTYICRDRGTGFTDNPVTVIGLKIAPIVAKVFYPYQILLAGKLIRTLDRLNPDVIITRVASAFTGVCAYFGRSRDIPVVWHVANITDLIPPKRKLDRTYPMHMLNNAAMKYGIRRVSHIVAQAQYQDDLLKELFGRTADVIIPNFFPPMTAASAEKSSTSTVLWVANLKPKKRPEDFIWLAQQFLHVSNVEFVMVGRSDPSEYQLKLQALIDDTRNLTYLGEVPVQKVNQLMAQACIFVNTSDVEGFPNTFIQAWMNQLPVVTLSFDPDSVLVDNTLGFCSGSKEQMRKDVTYLLENKADAKLMGERADAHAQAHHSIESNLSAYMSLIESVAK
ncbi:MAG: glycosyltransferase family 4 protein [Pseudomonadota bacterium]